MAVCLQEMGLWPGLVIVPQNRGMDCVIWKFDGQAKQTAAISSHREANNSLRGAKKEQIDTHQDEWNLKWNLGKDHTEPWVGMEEHTHTL